MLAAGSDALTLFDRPTLAAKGVPAAVRAHPNFVPAAYMVHGAQYFDAAFFGISPHEARLMDPQHRLFMQVAWGALEHARVLRRLGWTQTSLNELGRTQARLCGSCTLRRLEQDQAGSSGLGRRSSRTPSVSCAGHLCRNTTEAFDSIRIHDCG